MKKIAFALLAAMMLLSMLLPAAAMAAQYTLTIEHQGFDMKEGTSSTDEGSPFKLTSIGVVRPNGKIHARLAAWTEVDVPAGEKPVEIAYTSDAKNPNLTNCEFAMPARDVKLVAQWEDCAVTEYNLYAGAKKGTRIYCKPGEKTPAHDGTPEYRDYVFMGWFPPVKEKADESREYYALWADRSELEAAAPVITAAERAVRFLEDLNRFEGSVWLGGVLLEEGKDYTVSRGSTIITLSEDRIETMKNGGHELVASFYGVKDNGNIDKKEILKRVKQVEMVSTPSEELPDTGDNSTLVLWMSALTAAAAAMLLRRRRTA